MSVTTKTPPRDYHADIISQMDKDCPTWWYIFADKGDLADALRPGVTDTRRQQIVGWIKNRAFTTLHYAINAALATGHVRAPQAYYDLGKITAPRQYRVEISGGRGSSDWTNEFTFAVAWPEDALAMLRRMAPETDSYVVTEISLVED